MAKKQLDYRDIIKNNVAYINQQLGFIEQEDFTNEPAYRFIQERVPSEFKNGKFRLLPYSKVKDMTEEQLKQYATFITRYKKYKTGNIANTLTFLRKSHATFVRNNPQFEELSFNNYRELFKNSDLQRISKNFGSQEMLIALKRVPFEKVELFLDELKVDSIQTITSLRREAERIKEML